MHVFKKCRMQSVDTVFWKFCGIWNNSSLKQTQTDCKCKAHKQLSRRKLLQDMYSRADTTTELWFY